MSRSMRRLRDWPDCLKRLTVEGLRKERDYWRPYLSFLRHAQARKEVAKRIREIEAELERRMDESQSSDVL